MCFVLLLTVLREEEASEFYLSLFPSVNVSSSSRRGASSLSEVWDVMAQHGISLHEIKLRTLNVRHLKGTFKILSHLKINEEDYPQHTIIIVLHST